MAKDNQGGHSQDYDRKHKQVHDIKKDDGSKPIIPDTRKDVRRENTNHFTNRAPKDSQ